MKIDLRNAWKQYRLDNRGTLTAFVLINFVMMVLAAGIAVDIVRYEQQRACFQSVLDNGVLSASSLRATSNAGTMVEQALVKSDCNLEYSYNPPVINDTNYTDAYREVSASVDAKFDTYFLSFFGYDNFNMNIAAHAIEANPHTEISLVLDTSGSMDNSNRIINLRPAAVDFVEEMFRSNSDAAEPRISISVIPYAAKTNAGPAIANIVQPSTAPYSDCFVFSTAAYTTTEWTAFDENGNLAFEREPTHSLNSPYYPSGTPTADRIGHTGLNPCKQGVSNFILPMSHDFDKIEDMIMGDGASITGLVAEGGTGIDTAVKWGVSLLDPSFRPVIASLNALVDADGNPDVNHPQYVDDLMVTRPSDYSYNGFDQVNSKHLIIMTDGENTEDFYYQDRSETLTNAWINGDGTSVIYSNPGSNSGWTQLTWPELWSTVSAVHWLNGNNQALSFSKYAQHIGTVRTVPDNNYVAYAETDGSGNLVRDMDVNLRATCDAFKAREAEMASGSNLRIYSIAFEAPPAGQAIMQYCASSGHYFFIPETGGVTIADVFGTIAKSIESLRMIH